jgi:hypothetical protein
MLNELYQREWRSFHKFFCPSVKLFDKKRIGSKTVKQHDTPKIPYQRIVESPVVPQNTKKHITKYLEKQNPFLLKNTIKEKLKKIFSLMPVG